MEGRRPVEQIVRNGFDMILRVILLVSLLGPSASPWAFRAQQDQERIRVQTTLVNVPVLVSDRQGRAVLGLQATDFALFDEDVRQSLGFFAAATEPIRVALLLDTSKSMTADLDRIRKAASGFIPQLRPQDQAMVVSFDSEVHVLCRLSDDADVLKRAVRSAQIGEYVGTKMYDAITLAVEKHLRPVRGRIAVLLLSDGQDYGSRATPDEVIRTVVDSGAVVYPVFYRVDRRALAKKLFGVSLPKRSSGGAAWDEEAKAAAAQLRRIAEESTGAFYESAQTDLKQTFARVAEELRHQYLMAFYPEASRLDGAQHKIRVMAAHPDLVVRARKSYQAGAEMR
jgi:Ca-activated chloride channel homolog